MVNTLEWTDEGVVFIDQTKLPTEEIFVTCKNYEEVADAIRTMIVRGAPAIGVAAAMGVAIGARDLSDASLDEFRSGFDEVCRVIGGTRPTAVNLFWAIRRMQRVFEDNAGKPIPQIKSILIAEAKRMHIEDIEANRAMGRHGAALLPSRRSSDP